MLQEMFAKKTRNYAIAMQGNDQEFLTQDFQLQLLPQGRGREVSRRGHQHHQVLQPLITQNPPIFQVVALFQEAKSFLNFPARQLDWHDPP